MAKILTLTLNPAVDISTNFAGLVAEQKIRCDSPQYDAGGGGINVSKALAKLGVNSTACFLTGGEMGSVLNSLVKKESFETKTVEIEGNTRVNFTSFDTNTHAQYRFTTKGPIIHASEIETLMQFLATTSFDILVLSGSLPEGADTDLYHRIAAIAEKKDAKTILDTSGTALEKALSSAIFLAKPNITELSKLINKSDIELENLDEAVSELIQKTGVKNVVISLGPKGAFWSNGIENGYIPAPVIQVNSTVGAGDSMVAGLTYALSEQKTLKEAALFGVACGSAATMNTGTQLFNKADVDKIHAWLLKKTNHA